MKTLYIILVLFLNCHVQLSAQDIRDKNGIKTGSVDEKGIIRDKNGIKEGTFDKDGDVRDKNGIKQSRIDDEGTIRDMQGIKIGSIGKDGTVRDKNGIKLGEICDEGTVRDKNGIKIGSAKGVDKKQAAWMFFFGGMRGKLTFSEGYRPSFMDDGRSNMDDFTFTFSMLSSIPPVGGQASMLNPSMEVKLEGGY